MQTIKMEINDMSLIWNLIIFDVVEKLSVDIHNSC